VRGDPIIRSSVFFDFPDFSFIYIVYIMLTKSTGRFDDRLNLSSGRRDNIGGGGMISRLCASHGATSGSTTQVATTSTGIPSRVPKRICALLAAIISYAKFQREIFSSSGLALSILCPGIYRILLDSCGCPSMA